MSTMKPTGSLKFCLLTVLTVFYLVPLTIGESKGSSLLRDALRNNTRYEQSNERKEDGVEALKIEAQKFLKQCGGTLNQSTNNSDNRYGSGTGSDRNYSNKQNNNKGYGSNMNEDRFGNRNNNNNGQSGSSWENSNNDGDWNINSRRGNGQNPNNAYGNEENYSGPSNNNNPSSSFGLNVNQPDRRNYDMWTPPRRYQPSGSNNDFNVKTRYDGNLRFNNRPSSEECGDQGHNGNVPRSPFGNSNLPRRLRSSYFNREDDDNDNDCISQCVLGYMQLLDADRSPSETLIIKWLQEHVTRNEMDRIKALRETRKCFGKLVTTDIEDGCEYAKELSKCLELDLE